MMGKQSLLYLLYFCICLKFYIVKLFFKKKKNIKDDLRSGATKTGAIFPTNFHKS